ncbi:MAG: 50S ribosomal protein L28 [Clostridia bacterium]
MSRVCAICSKGQLTGNKVSHSNRKYKRAWGANVQKVRVAKQNGSAENIYVCTRCLRSGLVERA